MNAPPFSLTSRIACNGENGRNGEKSPASDNLSWIPNVAPWRMAILAKIARRLVISRMWQIFKLDAKSGPFKLYN